MIPWWVAVIAFFVGGGATIAIGCVISASWAEQAEHDLGRADIESEILSDLDPVAKRNYDQSD